MQIGKLDHVNLRTQRLDEMIDWYGRVLGMPAGDRPDFPFPGAWLYADGQPTIHLNGCEAVAAQSNDLTLEHFALRASGLEGFIDRLKREQVDFKIAAVPGAPVVQINVWDPDGNHVHIDFAAAEADGLDLPNKVGFGVGGRLIPIDAA